MKDLIIVGAGNGDIIKLIEDINSSKTAWNIIGFTERDRQLIGKERFGYPVLGIDEEILPKYPNAWVAINVARNTNARWRAVRNVRKFTSNFAQLIHPLVNINHCEIGQGVIIFAGVILGYNIRIRDFSIIHHSVTIGHDAMIGKYSIINPGVLISGRCRIGEGVLIGTGAMLVQEIEIGDWSSISMGSVVLTNVKENVIYMVKSNSAEIPRKPQIN